MVKKKLHLFFSSQITKLIKNSRRYKKENYKSHSSNIKQCNKTGFWIFEGKGRGNYW